VARMITEETLPTLLASEGYEFTTEEYEDLLTIVKAQIEARLPLPLTPREYTQFMVLDHTLRVVLDFFPVTTINSITVDDEVIVTEEYRLDCNDGVLYLKNPLHGLLKVVYMIGLSEEDYTQYILPLILDMLKYNLSNGWDKDASSIKEGDVSVNYDTSLSLGALIQNRLNNLETRYGCYVRMI
jgi:hypothetical protein